MSIIQSNRQWRRECRQDWVGGDDRMIAARMKGGICNMVVRSAIRYDWHCWWCKDMEKRESGYIRQRMLKMKFPGRWKRARPQQSLLDVVIEDMKWFGVTEEDAMEAGDQLWRLLKREAKKRWSLGLSKTFYARVTQIIKTVILSLRHLDKWCDCI